MLLRRCIPAPEGGRACKLVRRGAAQLARAAICSVLLGRAGRRRGASAMTAVAGVRDFCLLASPASVSLGRKLRSRPSSDVGGRSPLVEYRLKMACISDGEQWCGRLGVISVCMRCIAPHYQHEPSRAATLGGLGSAHHLSEKRLYKLSGRRADFAS